MPSRYPPVVDQPAALLLLAEARVAVLGTITPEGRPHLVPCCFVLDGDTIYSAVDAKPKTTMALQRLENLRASSAASLLAHHYTEDWSALWWMRVDGHGWVVEDDEALEVPIEEPVPPAVTTPLLDPVVSAELASAERT